MRWVRDVSIVDGNRVSAADNDECFVNCSCSVGVSVDGCKNSVFDSCGVSGVDILMMLRGVACM